MRRKIQKALALASNNPSEEEAKTALLLAQRLMLKHNMTEAEFEDEQVKKEVVETEATHAKKLYWYEKRLSNVIAENFRCYRFWQGRGNKNKIVFFGLKEDTKIASDVYNYAITYMNSLCNQFIKENQLTHDRLARNDYRLGFIDGLERQLNEQVQEYGLILVKDPDVVEEHNENRKNFRLFPNLTPKTISRFSNYQKGEQDGQSFDYKRKKIAER